MPATHLIVPCTEAPLDFNGGDGLHSVRTAQLVGSAVGEAHVLDLALVDQSLACGKCTSPLWLSNACNVF